MYSYIDLFIIGISFHDYGGQEVPMICHMLVGKPGKQIVDFSLSAKA